MILNLLIVLRGLKGSNYENPISLIEGYIVMNNNLYYFCLEVRSLLNVQVLKYANLIKEIKGIESCIVVYSYISYTVHSYIIL